MRAFVLSLTAVSALLITSAGATVVKGAGYTVDFPCQAKTVSQTMKLGQMPIPIVSHSCDKDGSLYYVVVSTYPKGFIANKKLDDAFYDAVAGSATNVRGTVRSDNPITLGKVPGHDALIDVKKSKTAAHLRVFFVGDRQYQVLVAGPAGKESGKLAMGFLTSFKLK